MPPSTPGLRLAVLPVSPWSEQARWALDHHGLAYDTIDHAPFLGERRLRRLAGGGDRRVTVPLLLAGNEVIADSFDIARYADREGRGAALIPAGREPEVREWNDLSEATKRAGRPLIVAGLLASPAALNESFPPEVPRALRPLLRPLARHGTRWFARKYDLRLDDTPAHLAALRASFAKLRAGLAAGSPYLLGTFSYADVVMATCVQALVPVADRYLPLGPATRQLWTRDDLAAEFADLVAWRDRLYEQHRAPRA